MTSKTDIFNMVCGVLDESARIDTWTEDSPNANRIRTQYDLARRELLQMHPWTFAKRRTSTAKYATNPAFGWSYQYPIPQDYIQMHPLQEGGTFEGDSIAYDIEQLYISETEIIRVIVTNVSGPIKFTYTSDIDDPALFSPLFIRAFVFLLASYVGHAITRKDSYAKRMKENYRETIVMAKGADNMARTMAKPDDSYLVDLHEEYLGSN